jgi:fructose-1-phosphate kinase PfkB-like protein
VGEATARRPGWLTISGSIPVGAPDGAIRRLIDLAHQANRRVGVDLHDQALSDALEAQPDLVKVNAEEAADTLGADAEVTPAELARLLAGRARTGAIVTAGVDGAYAVSHSAGARRVRSSRSGRFPVGSGDCLLAALVAGMDAGQDLTDALVTSSAVATANALTPGAACFDPADVATLLGQIEVR